MDRWSLSRDGGGRLEGFEAVRSSWVTRLLICWYETDLVFLQANTCTGLKREATCPRKGDMLSWNVSIAAHQEAKAGGFLRVKSWTCLSLCYADRLRLISFVLQSMTKFWWARFTLQKMLRMKTQQICSSFLWKGKDSSAAQGPRS